MRRSGAGPYLTLFSRGRHFDAKPPTPHWGTWRFTSCRVTAAARSGWGLADLSSHAIVDRGRRRLGV